MKQAQSGITTQFGAITADTVCIGRGIAEFSGRTGTITSRVLRRLATADEAAAGTMAVSGTTRIIAAAAGTFQGRAAILGRIRNPATAFAFWRFG